MLKIIFLKSGFSFNFFISVDGKDVSWVLRFS